MSLFFSSVYVASRSFDSTLDGIQKSFIYLEESEKPRKASAVLSLYTTSEQEIPLSSNGIVTEIEKRVPEVKWFSYALEVKNNISVTYPSTNFTESIKTVVLPEDIFLEIEPSAKQAIILYQDVPFHLNSSYIDIVIDPSGSNISKRMSLSSVTPTTGVYFESKLDPLQATEKVLLIRESEDVTQDFSYINADVFIKFDIDRFSSIERFYPDKLADKLLGDVVEYLYNNEYQVDLLLMSIYSGYGRVQDIVSFQYFIVFIFVLIFSPILLALFFSINRYWWYFRSVQNDEMRIYRYRGLRVSSLITKMILIFSSSLILSLILTTVILSSIYGLGIWQMLTDVFLQASILITLVGYVLFLGRFVWSMVVSMDSLKEQSRPSEGSSGMLSVASFIMMVFAIITVKFLSIDPVLPLLVGVVASIMFLLTSAGFMANSLIPWIFRRSRKSKYKKIFLATARMRGNRGSTRNLIFTSFFVFMVIFTLASLPVSFDQAVGDDLMIKNGGYAVLSSGRELTTENISTIAEELDEKFISTVTLSTGYSDPFSYPVSLIAINRTELQMTFDTFYPGKLKVDEIPNWNDGSGVISDSVVGSQTDVFNGNKVSLNASWFGSNRTEIIVHSVLKRVPDLPGSAYYTNPESGGWTLMLSDSSFDDILTGIEDPDLSYNYIFLQRSVLAKESILREIKERFSMTLNIQTEAEGIREFFRINDLLSGLITSTALMIVLYFSVLMMNSIIEINKRVKFYSMLNLSKRDIAYISAFSLLSPSVSSMIIALVGTSVFVYLLLVVFGIGFLRPYTVTSLINSPVIHPSSLLLFTTTLAVFSVFSAGYILLVERSITMGREKDSVQR